MTLETRGWGLGKKLFSLKRGVSSSFVAARGCCVYENRAKGVDFEPENGY